MLVEWIECHQRLVCVVPVVLGYLPNLELLLGAVQALSQQRGGFEALWNSPDQSAALDLCQTIANLHERGDRPGIYGFPVWGCRSEEIQRLFFDGAIYTLNQLPDQPDDTKSDPAQADYYPPHQCANLVDSYLADLTNSLGSFSEARAVVFSRSIASVMDYHKRLNGLREGKDKREEKGLKKWYWEEIAPTKTEQLANFFGE